MNKITQIVKSFAPAIRGVKQLSTERNFQVHILALLFSILAMVLLKLDSLQTVVIFLLVSNVMSAEAFNSALEDISDQQKRLGLPYENAGNARDLAAGGVLITAFFAVIVGLMIIWPNLIEAITPLLNN